MQTITVLLGDPNLPDESKPGGRYTNNYSRTGMKFEPKYNARPEFSELSQKIRVLTPFLLF